MITLIAATALAFSGGDHTTRIDNPYWPMKPGSRWVYRETDRTAPGSASWSPSPARPRRSRPGSRASWSTTASPRTASWSRTPSTGTRRTAGGNVWYLGEDTTEYENGKVVSTAGSWEAGVDGARAGIVMPARPRIGMEYRQEHAPGEAEDEARVLSLDEQVEVPFGRFRRALMTRDTNPLEPRVNEYKLYARGVGPVMAIGVSGGGGVEELLRFEKG